MRTYWIGNKSELTGIPGNNQNELPMRNLRIRTAVITDAEAIAITGRISYRNAFAHLFVRKEDLERYFDYAMTTEKIKRSLGKENNRYWVAELKSKVVGFIKLKKYSLHPLISSVWQSELQKLYILPGYQGMGIGKKLMETVFCEAEKLRPDFLWLDVLKSNPGARALYERMGFRFAGEQTFRIGSQLLEFDILKRPVTVSSGDPECVNDEFNNKK